MIATTTTATREIHVLETQARQDYRAVEGRIIYPEYVYGFSEKDNSIDISTEGEIGFRVLSNAMESDILNWQEDWLSPNWDLEEVIPGQTVDFLQRNLINTLWGDKIPLELRSFSTGGISYTTKGVPHPKSIKMLKPWYKRIFSSEKFEYLLAHTL